VGHRLPDGPFAWGRNLVELRLVDAQQEPSKIAERALRHAQDCYGLGLRPGLSGCSLFVVE
jgi:hypothetical protein